MEKPSPPSEVYQLRIAFRDIHPAIWRRLQAPSDLTLQELHEVFQIAFGWNDEHEHEFVINGKRRGDGTPEDWLEDDDVRLDEFGPQRLKAFSYTYNPAVPWECDVRLESTPPRGPRRQYPVCTGGSRAAPPEHCMDYRDYLMWQDAYYDEFPHDALKVMADTVEPLLGDKPAPLEEVLEGIDRVQLRAAMDRVQLRAAMDRVHAHRKNDPEHFDRRATTQALRTWARERRPGDEVKPQKAPEITVVLRRGSGSSRGKGRLGKQAPAPAEAGKRARGKTTRPGPQEAPTRDREDPSQVAQPRGRRGQQPSWQPIAMLPMIARLIDEQVTGLEERYQALLPARAQPHVLDDATVGRVIRLHVQMLEDAWLFEEQTIRWRPAARGAQLEELDRLQRQMGQYRAGCQRMLALASELRRGTIESVIHTPDDVLGLAVLTGKMVAGTPVPFRLPDGVTSEREALSGDAVRYHFAHVRLGHLGRLTSQARSDGQTEMVAEFAEVAGEAEDRRQLRIELFLPFAFELTRRVVDGTGQPLK